MNEMCRGEDITRPPFRKAGRGITQDHILVTDELIDSLANRFLDGRVREITGCTFELYILHPEAWERIAKALREGKAVRYQKGYPEIIEVIVPGRSVVD